MSVPVWEQASNGPPTRVLYGNLPDEPGGLVVSTKLIGMDEETAPIEAHSPRETHSRLCLFKLNMLGNRPLAATFRFKCLGPNRNVASGFYMGYNISKSDELCYIHVEIASPRPNQVQEKTIKLSFPSANSRLLEIGVYGSSMMEDPKPLALYEILNLTVKPRSPVESSWTINHVRVTERGSPPYQDKRLAWKWNGSDDRDLTCLPWSETTGPFSCFGVMVGGTELGRAYCTEFPIHSKDFGDCMGEVVEVVIRGHLFGGSEIASVPLQLSKDEVGIL